MRSLWKGAISFGLVNIPIKLYTATERQDVRFNYLHQPCNTPIRYEKVCPTCKSEVSPKEIVRGYEYAKGRYVIMSEQDLEGVAIEATKTVDIVDFVSLDQIDPIYFDKTYFLEPAETGTKAYQLLRQAMEQTGKIAVARIIIRSKQVLAVIRVFQGMLAMETIFFPAEIRSPEGLQISEMTVADKELQMATSLIDNLSVKFEPDKYRNNYRQALLDLIDRKIQGKEAVEVAPNPEDGKVVDLMAALEASLKAAQEQTSRDKKKKNTRKKAPTG